MRIVPDKKSHKGAIRTDGACEMSADLVEVSGQEFHN